MARIESIAKAGYFATPPSVTESISSSLVPAPSKGGQVIRALDPCAGEGVALRTLASALGAESYGIELSSERAAECRNRLSEVVEGNSFSARVSHHSWGLLYLNPPYEDTQDGKRRREHAFLTHWTGEKKALASGGVLVWVVPQKVIAGSARVLANNYSHLSCYRFPDPLFERFHQVVLFGVRKENTIADRDAEARIREWSEGELPPLPDEGAGPYTVPALPDTDVTFSSLFFDPSKASIEAASRGAWTLPGVAEQLSPADTGFANPLMPLRRGHLALLTAAGFLDNRVLSEGTERVIVKGRAVKHTVKVDSGSQDTVTEREVLRTEVTSLYLGTGLVEELGTGTGLSEFLERFGSAITDEVRDAYPPLYNAANRHSWGFDLSGLLRRPKGAQADLIRAAAASLTTLGVVTVSGEMGVGKSYVGAAAAWLAGGKRVAVVCPGHLVRKWVREVERTVPAAKAVVVRNITELERALSRTHTGTMFVVMSKEQAKLGYRWRPAVNIRKAVIPETGARYDRLCCPECGSEILDTEGNPVTLDELGRRRHRCTASLGKDRKSGRLCDAPLWQAVASAPKTGRGSFRFGNVPVGNEGDGPRRYSLADYISRHRPQAFDTCIIDEVHEMAQRGTAQGMASGQIAGKARRVIALTGTVFGGRASSLYYLRYRFGDAAFRREWGYTELAKWISRYGIVERISKYDGDVTGEGAMSRRKLISSRTRELPGMSPAMLFHIVGDTAFLKLTDVATNLPPYTECIHLLGLDEDSWQKHRYRALETELHHALIQALASKSKRLLGAYLHTLLAWPDACFREETVIDPHTERVIASAQALDAQLLYPKEQELVKLCSEQRRKGRKALVYLQHTEGRDITPRLERILTDAGLRVTVLKANTVSPDRREEWLSRHASATDVLLCHPRLVRTGLDLIDYPCLIFYQTEYSVYTLRQASRRSWRIGQRQPVEVHHFAYSDTIQAQALALIGKKMRAALLVEGEIASEGISEMGQDSSDVVTELARKLADGEGDEDGSLEQLFGETQELERSQDEYLDGFTHEEEPEIRVVDAPLLTPSPQPEEIAALWERVFSGEQVEETMPEPEDEQAARTVTWEELLQTVERPKPSRRKKPPKGQLELF